MHSMRGILFCWILFNLASCKNSPQQTETYFDSLIVAQVKYLSNTHPSLIKTAKMNGTEAQSTSQPDSTIWKSELDIFRQLALFERASFRDAYQLKKGLNDPKSNLLVDLYLAKEPIPIPELRFYYFRNLTNLKRIEATYQQHNALYSTTRQLVLEFDEIKGKPVLINYAMDGSEKMILGDSVKFSMRARINYPI